MYEIVLSERFEIVDVKRKNAVYENCVKMQIAYLGCKCMILEKRWTFSFKRYYFRNYMVGIRRHQTHNSSLETSAWSRIAVHYHLLFVPLPESSLSY